MCIISLENTDIANLNDQIWKNMYEKERKLKNY